jgi:hypothetical protein
MLISQAGIRCSLQNENEPYTCSQCKTKEFRKIKCTPNKIEEQQQTDSQITKYQHKQSEEICSISSLLNFSQLKWTQCLFTQSTALLRQLLLHLKHFSVRSFISSFTVACIPLVLMTVSLKTIPPIDMAVWHKEQNQRIWSGWLYYKPIHD